MSDPNYTPPTETVSALADIGWRITECIPRVREGVVRWTVTIQNEDDAATMSLTGPHPEPLLADLLRYAQADASDE